MLLHLHVKNLALIEEEEVSFSDGLNILTGETGAGKSIIIGSVNLALGSKADKALIRTGAPYALIEMIFSLDNDRQREILERMELPAPEDGTVLIKRKILPGRSICSVCGETVTLRQLREIAQCMLDIYGQRENQRLLRREAQLDTIDDFAGEQAAARKEKVRAAYRLWRSLQKEWTEGDLDTAARRREADLLSYEVKEIEEAAIKEGEDEWLEETFRKMSSFDRIRGAAETAFSLTGGDGYGDNAAADCIGRAVREMTPCAELDEGMASLTQQLTEVEELLSDFNRSLKSYLMDLSYDPGELEMIRERLNVINRIKDKYGPSLEDVRQSCEERRQRLAFLEDYENQRAQLEIRVKEAWEALRALCTDLSAVRREAAEEFAERLRKVLPELNFLQADFRVELTAEERSVTENGWDQAAFFISMNPGEAPRRLEQIASGGELSRIMLGIKTVFAGKDDIHTFIFDEIDTGISGQTAWKVAQKLGTLARDHQILCITHLPQIAAMQDSHYLIAKHTAGDRTVTNIRALSDEESDAELARLLGGETITEATLRNAREMKEMAAAAKREGAAHA